MYKIKLKELKPTLVTALKYTKNTNMINTLLREGRTRVQLKISGFPLTYPLVSTISLATRTLMLDPTLFYRPEGLKIAFHLPEHRIKQTNYVLYQRT